MSGGGRGSGVGFGHKGEGEVTASILWVSLVCEFVELIAPVWLSRGLYQGARAVPWVWEPV